MRHRRSLTASSSASTSRRSLVAGPPSENAGHSSPRRAHPDLSRPEAVTGRRAPPAKRASDEAADADRLLPLGSVRRMGRHGEGLPSARLEASLERHHEVEVREFAVSVGLEAIVGALPPIEVVERISPARVAADEHDDPRILRVAEAIEEATGQREVTEMVRRHLELVTVRGVDMLGVVHDAALFIRMSSRSRIREKRSRNRDRACFGEIGAENFDRGVRNAIGSVDRFVAAVDPAATKTTRAPRT